MLNVDERGRGFTLIELLVVIAIIALLAALLMPSLRSAQETARTSKCAGNLEQIGVAMFNFSNDHSGCFPESGETIAWNGTDNSQAGSKLGPWMRQISTYVGSPSDPQLSTNGSVYTCPSSSLMTSAYPYDKYYSYFNGARAAYLQTGGFAPVRRSLITHPAETILSGDVTYWGDSLPADDADKDDCTQNPIIKQAAFHNGAINILFADGHVATVQWSNAVAASGTNGGYFDRTKMCTHYEGTIAPQGGYNDY